jgi:hypothetical protein
MAATSSRPPQVRAQAFVIRAQGVRVFPPDAVGKPYFRRTPSRGRRPSGTATPNAAHAPGAGKSTEPERVSTATEPRKKTMIFTLRSALNHRPRNVTASPRKSALIIARLVGTRSVTSRSGTPRPRSTIPIPAPGSRLPDHRATVFQCITSPLPLWNRCLQPDSSICVGGTPGL